MTTISRDEVMAKLTGVFRDVFNDPSIQINEMTTSADVPSWDSLNQIKLILTCENEFGIRLKPRDINALSNVGEMIDHIVKALERKAR